jgi:hypothetical protein
MLSSNPRVGEIKLEEIVDRSIVRRLDDSGSIDRTYSIYPATRSYIEELMATELALAMVSSESGKLIKSKVKN